MCRGTFFVLCSHYDTMLLSSSSTTVRRALPYERTHTHARKPRTSAHDDVQIPPPPNPSHRHHHPSAYSRTRIVAGEPERGENIEINLQTILFVCSVHDHLLRAHERARVCVLMHIPPQGLRCCDCVRVFCCAWSSSSSSSLTLRNRTYNISLFALCTFL